LIVDQELYTADVNLIEDNGYVPSLKRLFERPHTFPWADGYPTGKEYMALVRRGSSSTGPFTDKYGNLLTDVQDPPTSSLVLGSHNNVYAPGGMYLRV